MTDEQLFRLIQNVQQQPEGSRQYQVSINNLLNECQGLPGLLRSSHPNYLDALNETWEWVWRNIKKFEVRLDSVRESLVVWINGYLCWRIKDLYRESSANTLSLELLLQLEEESPELLEYSLLPKWDIATYSLLEEYVKLAESESVRLIGLALAQVIRIDPQDKLRSIHLRGRAECNCKLLSHSLLLKQPPDTLASVSQELNVNAKTALSHWKNKCKPCLQRIAIELNYQVE